MSLTEREWAGTGTGLAGTSLGSLRKLRAQPGTRPGRRMGQQLWPAFAVHCAGDGRVSPISTTHGQQV